MNSSQLMHVGDVLSFAIFAVGWTALAAGLYAGALILLNRRKKQ